MFSPKLMDTPKCCTLEPLEAREVCNTHLPSYVAGVMEKLTLCSASNLHDYSVACWHDFVLCQLACSSIRSESDWGFGVIKDHSQNVNKSDATWLPPLSPSSLHSPPKLCKQCLTSNIPAYQTQIV